MSTADEIRLIELIRHPHPNAWDEACELFGRLAHSNYSTLIKFASMSSLASLAQKNSADIEDAVCESLEKAMLHLKNHFNGKAKPFVFGMPGQVTTFKRWVQVILWNGKWGVLDKSSSAAPLTTNSDEEDDILKIPDNCRTFEDLQIQLAADDDFDGAVSQLPLKERWATTLSFGLFDYDVEDEGWLLNHALKVGFSVSEAKRMQLRARNAKLITSKWTHASIATTLDCSPRHVGYLLQAAMRRLRRNAALRDIFHSMETGWPNHTAADLIYYIRDRGSKTIEIKVVPEVSHSWVFSAAEIKAYVERYPDQFDAIVEPDELFVQMTSL